MQKRGCYSELFFLLSKKLLNIVMLFFQKLRHITCEGTNHFTIHKFMYNAVIQ